MIRAQAPIRITNPKSCQRINGQFIVFTPLPLMADNVDCVGTISQQRRGLVQLSAIAKALSTFARLLYNLGHGGRLPHDTSWQRQSSTAPSLVCSQPPSSFHD